MRSLRFHHSRHAAIRGPVQRYHRLAPQMQLLTDESHSRPTRVNVLGRIENEKAK